MQEENEQKKKQQEQKRKEHGETFTRAREFLRKYFDKVARELKEEA